MIFDFALDPELVATWHERRAAYPVLCQMGPGEKRIPCAFPVDVWPQLVVAALRGGIPVDDTAAWQTAKKKIEILLRHLQVIGTRRKGAIGSTETWLDAACKAHSAFPFGGILVASSELASGHVIATDRLDEFPAWAPVAPPITRQPAELAKALAPLLRCASQVRFVDPYFDADDAAFLEPMAAYCQVMQNRPSVAELRMEVHFSVSPRNIEEYASVFGGRPSELDVASARLLACETQLSRLLRKGVPVEAFAWAKGPKGARMHNRYVLTEVGAVAVQTGLDKDKTKAQTDDLTILSKEQLQARWLEFSKAGSTHRLITSRQFVGITT